MITCNICQGAASRYPLKMQSAEIFYCRTCDTFIKQASQQDIELHLAGRGYTDLNNEQFLKQKRSPFFNSIIDQSRKYITPSTWLDFGCAYGHLPEILNSKGYQGYGVEINAALFDHCKRKGLPVFTSMEMIPASQRFNVISAIDSLYYDPSPTNTIKAFHQHLKEDGILIIRNTNRNWLIKCYKLLGIRSREGGMGDAFIGYSKKSIQKLLESAGFQILKYQYSEQGKRHSLFHSIFYNLTSIFSMLSFYRYPVTPGIIIIARKKPLID
ncbi:class I SAM-dependent methyltransferase [Chitinophaga sp. S165]|uniref:class I SAM-dependent methyltransferase n=1 Tax=Chitinophaga sp. S165 TaxID=2135462 RepID=UPI0013049D55|nr:class I SAM-dependent methyltransferase [Chitinophaga sp. S165]